MTLPMIITILITLGMLILIMTDRLPFGAPPLLACLLLVITGISTPAEAFAGFSNNTVIMLASFLALIIALQKTRLIAKFREALFNMAEGGGFKAYIMIIIVVMAGASFFGMGSTAYYVLTLGLLSMIPYSKKLPSSKIIMAAGIATNHPIIPLFVALQYSVAVGSLEAAGVSTEISTVKFAIVTFIVSVSYFIWCIISYRFLPDRPVKGIEEANQNQESGDINFLPRWKENVTYAVFLLAVVGMAFQSEIGDAGYAIPGLAVAVLMFIGAIDFKEIREALASPVVIMSAGVIGLANALTSTGLTDLVGQAVANSLGNDISPFVLIFVFCVLTSVLSSITGANIGTVYVFAPLAISVCVSMGFNPTGAAVAIAICAWCNHFLPIDGMPAMVLGMGEYNLKEWWKFTVPLHFVRLLAITVGTLLVFPL